MSMRQTIMTGVFGLGLAALAAIAPAQAQSPQPNCGLRTQIVEVLSQKYQERHQASGLQNAAAMVEVWASDTTGSWTILITRADGVSCIVASGQSWQEYEAVRLVEELPS